MMLQDMFEDNGRSGYLILEEKLPETINFQLLMGMLVSDVLAWYLD